jgi:predicted secreted protein
MRKKQLVGYDKVMRKRKNVRRAEILVFCILLSISYTIVTGSPQPRGQNYRISNQGPLVTQWEFFYGGTGSDRARGLIQTSDGGFAFTGRTTSYGAGGYDGWLVKTDANGVAQWNQTYGRSLHDDLIALVETADNGFFLAGFTASFGKGENDIWLIKTDSTGTPEWNKTFGSTGIDELDHFITTSDGGYLMCGRYNTPPDAWLIKLDSEGHEEWNRTFGGVFFDRLYSVIEVSSGGYLSVGWTGNTPPDHRADLIAYRHNSTGHEVWNVTDGGFEPDNGYDVLESSDGSFIIAGTLGDPETLNEIWLLKLSANGAKVWEKIYGGSQNDWVTMLLELDDGYLITSHSQSFGPGDGANWIIKVDTQGNALWNQTHGHSSGDELAYDMIRSSDGNFVLAGLSSSKGAGSFDAWLFKLEFDEDWTPPTSETTPSDSTTSFVIGPVFGVILALVLGKRRKKKG